MAVVIVADEQNDFWEALVGLLEQLGYKVVGVFGGERRIEVMRRLGLVVAEPLEVRLLELVSAGSNGDGRL